MSYVKLVQFGDGSFGIRKGWIFYSFLDAYSTTYGWYYNEDVVAKTCKFKTKQDAIFKYNSTLNSLKVIESL